MTKSPPNPTKSPPNPESGIPNPNTRPLRLFLAGHRGMVGSAVMRRFEQDNRYEVITRSRHQLDLTNQISVDLFFATEKPDAVILAAAKVGGIHANNTYPAEFMYENMMIEMNIIRSAHRHGVKRLLFLGSSCIYPREAPQPMPEDCLLTSPLEKTNEAYALAKIAGLKYCQYLRSQYGALFHSAMPTNLYGPGDNYHPENSHVLPALIRRFHEAKVDRKPSVTIWGTGNPQREFLHTDDLADALHFIFHLEAPPDWINVGYGEDIAILDLARLIAKVVGFEGEIRTDPSKPDGTPRKLMDNTRLRELGWKPKIDLETGIRHAYKDFQYYT